MFRPARRRRAIRRAHLTSCEAVSVERFRSIGRRIVDLSHRGARLAVDDDVDVGETVVLTFSAPRGTGVIDAVATVQRREGEFAGLAFVEMDWTDRALLFLELMGVPPPLPDRPPALDYAAAVQRIAISD